MEESELKAEGPKKERRFDPELLRKGLRCDLDQYEMLKRCSGKKDMTEWNEWRRKQANTDVLLEGVDLAGKYLEGVDLGRKVATYMGQLFHASNVYLGGANLERAYLGDAKLMSAHLEGTNLKGAYLKRADIGNAFLGKASLVEVDAQGANFYHSHLEETALSYADLEKANFSRAHMERSTLHRVNLRGAILSRADLRRVYIGEASLEGANFERVIVDGSTLIWECSVDTNTDFCGIGLDNVRVEPGTKQLLEYNIRRRNWEDWYPKQHVVTRWLVRKFWEMSDYGISTKKIMKTFLWLAFGFAAVYYAFGFVDYYLVGTKDHPGIVSDLFVLKGENRAVTPLLVPLRAIYFSVVTMTTLGFGDMYANAHGFVRGLLGHVLLMVQVILGYVLLGALVTRFAVLFTAGGPAGRFADAKDEKEK